MCNKKEGCLQPKEAKRRSGQVLTRADQEVPWERQGSSLRPKAKQ